MKYLLMTAGLVAVWLMASSVGQLLTAEAHIITNLGVR